MDENICRVFTFYSNFLPACTESHNWDYCAFGTIDGIDVGKESIITKDGEALECIWKEHVNFQKKLSGSYNAERIYGVRFGDKKVEEEFWKDEPEYPFLFFTRIQCEGDKLQMLDGGNRQALEHKLSEAGDIKIITYLTYGNSDLFFVIKAREYEDGAQIIHAMNQGMNLILDSDSVCYLKNSFSIMAVKHDWIDEMDDNNRRKLNEKKISASINIIKEPSQDCTELERIIKEMVSDADVQRTSVLGVDDEQIMIKEGGWADFLSLYRKNGGVFCNCNKKYRGIWAGTTTTIYTKLPNIKDKLQNKGIRFCGEMPGGKQKMEKILEKSKERKKWYNNQKKSLLEILKELQTQSIDKNFKEINIILNSVPRYAGELFNDYIFFSILPPLKFLLCLMLENLKIGFLNMRDYYDFLKAFCMYVQGSLASDRHTIQTIDFNSKIYEVPAKLIAFYSAYIHLVKKILSCQEDTNCKEEKKCEYEFLVAPGISNVVHVDELYYHVSNKMRLMKVEIPEYCLYNLHDMMVILTHETAHYVGREYRLRGDVRYVSILKNFSHIYVSYVRGWCIEEKVCECNVKNSWEIAEKRMESILNKALQRKIDVNYVSKVENEEIGMDLGHVVDNNKLYGKHMTQLQDNIQMAMIDIVQFGLENVFGPVLCEGNNSEELLCCIKQASERYIVVHEAGSTLMSCKTTLEVLAMLYEEGFADLMAILVLEMDPIEYVGCLLNDVKRQDYSLNDCYQSDLLYRVALVLQCCIVDGKLGTGFVQTLQKLEQTEELTEVEAFMRRALLACEKSCIKPVESKLYHRELKNILRDNSVIDEVLHYLICCGEKFHEINKVPSNEIQVIKSMFENYSITKNVLEKQEVSAEQQITEIMKVIEKIFDDLFYSQGK